MCSSQESGPSRDVDLLPVSPLWQHYPRVRDFPGPVLTAARVSGNCGRLPAPVHRPFPLLQRVSLPTLPMQSPYPASLCVRIGLWCGDFFILSCSLALRCSLAASLKFGLVPNLNSQSVQWSKVGSHAFTSFGEPPVQSRHLSRIAFKGGRPLTPFPNLKGQIGQDLLDRHSLISCGWSRQHQRHFILIASIGVLIAIYPILRR